MFTEGDIVPAKKRRRITSKAQMRFLMATKKSTGRKMAHRNIKDSGRKKWYKKLPNKKGK